MLARRGRICLHPPAGLPFRMATWLLNWNPAHFPWVRLASMASEIGAGRRATLSWSCGRTKRIQVGDRVFLMRVGSGSRGLVASGNVKGPVSETAHWEGADEDRTSLMVDVSWDVFREMPLIPAERLGKPPFEVVHWSHQSSGLQIPDGIVDELEREWTRAAYEIAPEGQDLPFREDPSEAGAVLARLYPDSADLLGCCRLLRSAIESANAQAPSSWSTTLFTDLVRLNVGQAEVVVLRRGDVYLVLDRSAVGPEDLALAATMPGGNRKGYSSVPGDQVTIAVPASRLEAIYPRFRAAHEAFIEGAARAKSASPFWRSFSPGVVLFLRKALGEPVPMPAFHLTEPEESSPTEKGPRAGAGFGDAEANREVERAAVEYVKRRYEERGWSVDSVESEKCGYDLRCSMAGEERHIEVKGVSGSAVQCILTAGELRCARQDPQFVLAIVTSALSEEPLHLEWEGFEVDDEFLVEPISYRLSLRGGDVARAYR